MAKGLRIAKGLWLASILAACSPTPGPLDVYEAGIRAERGVTREELELASALWGVPITSHGGLPVIAEPMAPPLVGHYSEFGAVFIDLDRAPDPATVIAHEVGHAIGWVHEDASQSPCNVMAPFWEEADQECLDDYR
jgi:hypothetical protein